MSVVKFKVIGFNNGCFIANGELVYASHSDYITSLSK